VLAFGDEGEGGILEIELRPGGVCIFNATSKVFGPPTNRGGYIGDGQGHVIETGGFRHAFNLPPEELSQKGIIKRD
jgi:hypothetical protein